MNQDFALPLTPSVARKLVRFSKTLNVQITKEIRAAAELDRLERTPFITLDKEYEIVQFILDSGMRAGLYKTKKGTINNHMIILEAVRLSGISPITIATIDSYTWNHAINRKRSELKAHNLSTKFLGEIVILSMADVYIAIGDNATKRNAVLIMDWNESDNTSKTTGMRNALAKEFRRVILNCADPMSKKDKASVWDMSEYNYMDYYDDPYQTRLVGWQAMGECLFPGRVSIKRTDAECSELFNILVI